MLPVLPGTPARRFFLNTLLPVLKPRATFASEEERGEKD